jgi:hypothetical protein
MLKLMDGCKDPARTARRQSSIYTQLDKDEQNVALLSTIKINEYHTWFCHSGMFRLSRMGSDVLIRMVSNLGVLETMGADILRMGWW